MSCAKRAEDEQGRAHGLGSGAPPSFGFERICPATKGAVRLLLISLRDYLRCLPMDQTQAQEIEIALAEALNNVAEHAYTGGRRGKLHLKLWQTGSGLFARLCDWGAPLPELTPPDAERPDTDVGLPDLPEGGFGWFLITHVASTVCYVRDGDQNRLDLSFARCFDACT